MAGPSWSVQTQAFPSRPARHHAPLGPQTRRQRDRTTTFPCSSHGWPWPGGVQFPGTQMEPSEAGPFGRGGARERTDFSPLGGNGGERTLRRRWPPYRVTPWGSSIATSVSTGGLRCHAAGAGGADAPPQQWDLWPNSKAFSLDKTVPPSIQGRHAPTPRLVHKPGGGEIGPLLSPVPPAQAVTAGAGPHRERKDARRRIFFASVSVEP